MYIVWILLAFLVPYVARLAIGPTIWDRFLSMSLISAKIGIIIVAYASIKKTAFLLDFAIAYTLLGFICIIFTALFLLEGRSNN